MISLIRHIIYRTNISDESYCVLLFSLNNAWFWLSMNSHLISQVFKNVEAGLKYWYKIDVFLSFSETFFISILLCFIFSLVVETIWVILHIKLILIPKVRRFSRRYYELSLIPLWGLIRCRNRIIFSYFWRTHAESGISNRLLCYVIFTREIFKIQPFFPPH